MQLGFIGLGRMGANMVKRLTRAGHRCVVFDIDRKAVDALVLEGATTAPSLEGLAALLEAPVSAPKLVSTPFWKTDAYPA